MANKLNNFHENYDDNIEMDEDYLEDYLDDSKVTVEYVESEINIGEEMEDEMDATEYEEVEYLEDEFECSYSSDIESEETPTMTTSNGVHNEDKVQTFVKVEPKPNLENASDCKKCDLHFESKDLLVAHKRLHERDKYKCSICGVQHKTFRQFQTHLEIDDVPYKCFYCPLEFPNICQLASHSIRHSKLPKKYTESSDNEENTCENSNESFESTSTTCAKAYKCSDCNKRFKSRDSLYGHSREHSEGFNSQVVIKCSSGSAPSLDSDVSEMIKYNCSYCDNCFDTMNELLVHKKQSHKHVKKSCILIHSCPDCTKCFSTIRALKMHRTKHEKTEKNQPIVRICTICWETFKTDDSLFEHRKECHNSQKPVTIFNCSVCGDIYDDINAYNNHKKVHATVVKTPESHKCAHCSKTFCNIEALNNHRKMHLRSLEEISGIYKICRYCTERFTDIEKLNEHENQHEENKKSCFKCSCCSKSFDDEKSLNDHKQEHLNILEKFNLHPQSMSFKCPYCSQTFLNMQESIEHKKSHFGNMCDTKFLNPNEKYVMEFVKFLVNDK